MAESSALLELEETLDPKTAEEWEAFRALAHQMVDDALDYQRDLRARPVWQPIPDEVKARLQEPLSQVGSGASQAYRDFVRLVLPYNYGNVHPRHWGWVNGQGSPLAVMAEMLAATMNPNCWGGEHAASYVEAQVLDWLRQALDFSPDATGLLVSGGSMANIVAIAAAREARAGSDISRRGLANIGAPPILYTSAEVHNSVDKAAAILGLGFEGVRKIAVDADFRLDTAALRKQIESDLADGLRPFCVVATAGTVNTGAIDPLEEIADLCCEYALWMHVDGAFGALAALAPALRPSLAGLTRADSVAFDLHKWLFMPIEIGCVLIRDEAAHGRPFSPPADYLQTFDRGPAAGEHFFAPLGPQLTRSFRALKAWMTMRAHGLQTFSRLIQQNVDHAQSLKEMIQQASALELMAPVSLNVVCFRYRGSGRQPTDLDSLNRELLMQLWESGVAVPSGTLIKGAFSIRCAFTNHRTRTEDLAVLVEKVCSLGDQLEQHA